MGIIMCEGSYYTIKTTEQAYLFFLFDVIYALCELLFIYKTVQIAKNKGITCESWELVGFYVSIHLVFIRTCCYLLGGWAVCYSERAYDLFETYFFIFKRIALFLLSYRMAKLLRQMESEAGGSFSEFLILALCAADVVAFSILYWVVDSELGFYVYIVAAELLLTAIFVLLARSVLNKMGTVSSYNKQNLLWKVFMTIMIIAFFVRVGQAIFNMWYSDNSKNDINKSFLYALYNALYLTITEIVPSLLMVWIISNSTEEAKNEDSLFASNYSDSP